MPVPNTPLDFVSVVTKDGHSYTYKQPTHLFPLMTTLTTPTHPLASFQNNLGFTLLQHATLQALPPPPPLAKEISSVGPVLSLHRFAPY